MAQESRWRGMATDSDFSLWRVLDHARFMIARSREMELARCGLTPEQSQVLDILHECQGSTTINQLVDITQRQHHSISTLVHRMTKQGLVTKRRSPRDKRQYEVVITEKGEEMRERMTRDSIRTIFASLSDWEKQQLRSYLGRLTRGAYSLLGKKPVLGPPGMGDGLPASDQ